MMSMHEQMEQAEKSILHTYNRFPVMFDRGEGCRLYDTEGKEYLDFAAGIAVNALGYHYPGYDEALKAQIDKLLHISNLYYNEPMSEAGEKLAKASGMSRAFFTNSGTESIEGALKAARKYSCTKYNGERYEIIAMNHSFHGRSMGALSVTGTAHYREPFEPLIGGVKFADFNDLESVKAHGNIFCMAGLRCKAGYYDLRQGSGLRCSGRRFCSGRKSGGSVSGTWRSWNHLWRKSLCVRSSEQGV